MKGMIKENSLMMSSSSLKINYTTKSVEERYGYQSSTRKVIQSEFLLIRIRLWICFNLNPKCIRSIL